MRKRNHSAAAFATASSPFLGWSSPASNILARALCVLHASPSSFLVPACPSCAQPALVTARSTAMLRNAPTPRILKKQGRIGILLRVDWQLNENRRVSLSKLPARESPCQANPALQLALRSA